MAAERTANRQTPLSLSDGATVAVEKEARAEAAIRHARTLSFRTMASMLLADITEGMPVSRSRTYVSLVNKATAPLAKEVAEERLNELGLTPFITLQVAAADEIIKKLNPEFKPPLSEQGIDARRAVTGYRWNKDTQLTEDDRRTLGDDILSFQSSATFAEESLISDHLDIVKSVMQKADKRKISFDDLVGEGNMSLVTAARLFDWRRGYPFSAYLRLRLKGTLLHTLRDKADDVKRPRAVFDNYSTVFGEVDRLNALQIIPTSDLIAQATGLTVQEVEEVLHFDGKNAVSLNQTSPVTGEELGTAIPGDESDFAERVVERMTRNVMVEAILARFDDKTRDILIRRFFLEQTQSEIGAAIGVSQMHVSRLISSALTLLRKELGVEIPDNQRKKKTEKNI